MTQQAVGPARLSHREEARRLALPAVTLVAALAGAGLVHAVDPNQPGHYPTCPFLAVTGLYCPGCGSARALHALTELDLTTALARNPIVPFCVAYLVLSWAAWTWRAWTGRPLSWLAHPRVLTALWVGLTAFWALRNVPGWTWLSPL